MSKTKQPLITESTPVVGGRWMRDQHVDVMKLVDMVFKFAKQNLYYPR